MVSWGLIVFVVGLAYGFLAKGRQNKMQMLKRGIIWGLILALVLWLIGFFLKMDPVGLGTGPVAIFVTVLILTVLFVVGVWLGDLLERVFRK